MFGVFTLFALLNMSWSFNIGQERDPFVYGLKGLTNVSSFFGYNLNVKIDNGTASG